MENCSPANGVSEAHFRLATQEESQAARGGIGWQVLISPWTLACKVMGTVEMVFRKANIISWQEPLLQDLVDRAWIYMGYNPENAFIQNIYSFFGNRHLLEGNKEVFKAFLSHYRSDEIFENSMSMKKLLEIIRKTFPDDKFTPEDFMFTCSAEQTKIYRALLHKMLNGKKIKEFAPLIQKNVQVTLKEWNSRCENGEQINITLETRLFTSKIITQLMFADDETSQKITRSIDFINYYIVKSIVSFYMPAKDEELFKDALVTFREAVDKILCSESIPLFEEKNNLSLSQKKALIFILFFAGQDTTASLLTHVLHELAINPDAQECLRKEIINSTHKNVQQIVGINRFFNRSIKEFTPAYGIGRYLKEDTCFEFQLENETEMRKRIFFKGETVAIRIHRLADYTLNEEASNYRNWFPFGFGPHSCPGEKLAREEIMLFLQELVLNYTIETEQKGDISRIGMITLQFSENIMITLKPREKIKED